MSDRLDSFARRAAQPMTRARALKLAGGAFVAASFPGLASPSHVVASPARLRGRASQSCPACPPGEDLCSIPRGVGCIRACCPSGWVCCKSEDEVQCCYPGQTCGVSQPPGATRPNIVCKGCRTGQEECGDNCCAEGSVCADPDSGRCCRARERACSGPDGVSLLRTPRALLQGQVLPRGRALLQRTMLPGQPPLLQGPLPEVPAEDEEVRHPSVLRKGRGVLRRQVLRQEAEVLRGPLLQEDRQLLRLRLLLG